MPVIFFLVICFIAYTLFGRCSDTQGVAKIAFEKLNEYRVGTDTNELIWDEDLEVLAITHSKYMDSKDILSHSVYTNSTYKQLHQNYGTVENILKGNGCFIDGNDIIAPWLGSPPHRSNLLNTSITKGAIGVSGNYATFLAR